MNGEACFTRDQAELASEYIAEMKLDTKVRAPLQKKKFDLPQVSEKVCIVYCNDDRWVVDEKNREYFSLYSV